MERQDAQEIVQKVRIECGRHKECTDGCVFHLTESKGCIFSMMPFVWEKSDMNQIGGQI